MDYVSAKGADVLKWIMRRGGPEWELRFVRAGATSYVMRCNSIVKMMGFLMPMFEDGSIRSDWEITCRSMTKKANLGAITPRCFARNARSELVLAHDFLQEVASIDSTYQVRGRTPEFYAAGSAGLMPIPLESASVAEIRRGDVDALRKAAVAGRKTEVTFYSVMRTIFSKTSASDVASASTPSAESVEPDGCTADTAFVISDLGSAEAIATEFRVLEAMFGKQDSDWKLHNRSIVPVSGSRRVEKFIVGHAGKRYEVFFDISATCKIAESSEAQDIMTKVVERQQTRLLSVTVSRKSLLSLYQILLHLPPSATISGSALDRKRVIEEVTSVFLRSGLMDDDKWADDPSPVHVELSAMEWVMIVAVLRTVGDAASTMPDTERDLLQEDLMLDLRDRVEDALKRLGPG